MSAPAYMSPPLAAQQLDISERTIRRWLAQGKIPREAAYKQPGGLWYISVAWVRQQQAHMRQARIES